MSMIFHSRDFVMARNFFTVLIVAIVPAVFAHEAARELDASDALKSLADGASKKILEISNALENTPKSYSDAIGERFECLQWECVVEQENVNKSTANAVAKGMSKNKKFASFQCVSNRSSETLEKLKAKCSGLPEESEKALKNGLNAVMPFRLLMPGFNKYVQDLYQAKKDELKKADNEDTKKKILLEVENKMKMLAAILDQMSANMETSGHNFFEAYVDFVYATENALKKIQREGSQKILACVG